MSWFQIGLLVEGFFIFVAVGSCSEYLEKILQEYREDKDNDYGVD